MAQLQEVWNKFNSRERMTAAGAGLVLLAWVLGIVARGFGVSSIGLVGAIAVLVVLYLKYTNPNINWPVAVPLITLGISAVVAAFALLTLIDWLGYLDLLGITAFLSLAIYVVGTLLMAWGSWQEYQVEKPALPNFSSASATPGSSVSSSTAPAAPPAAAPSAATEPPAAPPADDTLPR
jgi:hypothetical protein